MKKVDKATLTHAVNHMQANEMSLDETALMYGLSNTTLSRHMAEMGLKTLKKYKTVKEYEMLTYLSSRNINSLSELVKKV